MIDDEIIEGQLSIYDLLNEEVIMLTKEEIQKLMYCIDLVIQNFGDNTELEKIYDKLVKMKD